MRPASGTWKTYSGCPAVKPSSATEVPEAEPLQLGDDGRPDRLDDVGRASS